MKSVFSIVLFVIVVPLAASALAGEGEAGEVGYGVEEETPAASSSGSLDGLFVKAVEARSNAKRNEEALSLAMQSYCAAAFVIFFLLTIFTPRDVFQALLDTVRVLGLGSILVGPVIAFMKGFLWLGAGIFMGGLLAAVTTTLMFRDELYGERAVRRAVDKALRQKETA